jgi:diguanylate cyclase
LIAVVLAIAVLLHAMPQYKMVILNLYFLPVALSGFYLGRYRAGVLALLAALCAATVALVHAMQLEATAAPSVNFLVIAVWAAALGLTSLLIGTLSDERARKLVELHESHRTDTLADPLTGVANRRAFQYELTRRMTEWNRQQTSLALILIDIDRFKKFNDTYGHQAGDAVLREVASATCAAVREVDLVARFGGEEFGIILPNTNLNHAKDAAERVRSIIESSRYEYDGFSLRLTVSVGVAHVILGDDAASIIQRADAALYASKQAGRNCAHYHTGTACEHFGASLPSPPAEADGEGQQDAARPDAYSDTVTGLPSRKVFNEELRRRVAEAQRYDAHLSMMIVKVDDFTGIDERGPQAGDMVLAMTAEFIRAALRDSDLVSRYAKNEFAVMLPATTLADASIPAMRIRQRVCEYDALKYQGSSLSFSVSVGLAELVSAEGPGSFLKRVEEALREASAGGGNRLCTHDGKECQPAVGQACV